MVQEGPGSADISEVLRLPLIGRAAVRWEPVRRELDHRAVLRQGLRLHRRLLGKTLVIAFCVFVPLEIPVALAFALHVPGLLVALLAVAASCAGLGFLQGALAELVWDQHEDGDAKTTLRDLTRRCFDRLGAIASTSASYLIPGFALSGRRLLTVPVLVLADISPARAAFHARELAAVNEPALLRVGAGSVGIALGVQAPFLAVAMLSGNALVFWLVAVTAAALTMPYVAHASFVAYYALTQPYRPIVLDPGEKWQTAQTDEAPAVRLDATPRRPAAGSGIAGRERIATRS
jgi:hypothetical protein